jgi:arylesterase/paraoxonase
MSKENITQTVELEGCRLISGIIGPEDFEYLPQEKVLVVSSLDRRAPEGTTGGLYWIDLAKPPEEQVAEPILTDYPGHFKPHGLTFQPTEGGGRLFVISHPETGEWPHTIEVFSLTFSNGAHEWQHIQTLTDDALISPNDLVALPDGSLFISNDFQDLGGGIAGLLVDTLLRRKRAPLVYYDGTQFTDLDANVISSAGITSVKDGDHEFLYRDMMNKGVEKLEIHWDQPGDPRVELVKTIHLNTAGADNFTVDGEGVVYVATHYSFGLLTDHQGNENALSPTQIFKILPNGEATLIYANKGDEFSAGSVGTVVENRLLVGQIFNDGILSCPMEK